MLFKNAKLLDEDFNVQDEMYLRTQGAVISYIGKREPEKADGEVVYDAKNKFLMPGLYNTHCHVPMTILRGYGEGLNLQRWLTERIFPFEAHLDGDSVYAASLLGALELIAGGCVSISDQYFFIDRIADALYECGMKANLCHGLSDMSPDTEIYKTKGYRDTIALKNRIVQGKYSDSDSSAGIAGNEQERQDHTAKSRIKVDMGLHSEYTSCEEFIRQVAVSAREEGLNIHTHISETKKEHEECKDRRNGRTPVEFLRDMGVFDVQVQVAHCVYLEDQDIEIMREAGAWAIHNPSSNMKLASGIMPLKKYMSQGLMIGLGTDGASSNNTLNMMKEIHMAAMLARVGAMDANAIRPADIIRIATRNGALIQGREDSGILKEGFRADIIAINLDVPHMQPDYDTLSNVVFAAQSSDIVLNMIDGREVYRDGEYLFADKERIIFEADRAFKNILRRL